VNHQNEPQIGDPMDGSTVGFELEKRTYRVADLVEVGRGYDAALQTQLAETEFKRSVFEVITGILQPNQVWDAARSFRRLGAEVAASQGCLPLDSSLPLNIVGGNAISPEPRYVLQDELARGFGDPSPTGLHVHINVHDVDKRVEVRDRLSAYEHVLIALSGASPFELGIFRRVAAMRVERFNMLPTVFDPEWTGSYAAHLAHLRKHLQITDYWGRYPEPDVYRFAHPRTRVSTDGKPTVEIRVLECPLTLDDLMLSLYVSIGLTNRIILDVEQGLPPFARRDVHVEHPAMRKHATIFGLGSTLHDPETGRLLPAWSVIDNLARYIEPGLLRYDPSGIAGSHVRRLLAGLKRHGSAAQRLVRTHDAVYQARLDKGLPVADYRKWASGGVPMSRGTARDLVANVMLLNLYGDLTGSDAREVALMAHGFALGPNDGGDAFERTTAMLLDRHGDRLLRGAAEPREDAGIPWVSRDLGVDSGTSGTISL
jgi:gamma-glutamyl:cysteine ligase YbdK (ATP-grasp superfamily)